MIKVKHILLIVIFAFIIVTGIIVFKKKDIKVDEQQTIVEESETYYSKEGEGWLELGFKVAEKNGDWSDYPLTEHFRSKYNEKDGILGDIQFDKIEYRPFAGTDKDYYFKEYYTYFVITQGNKKTAYIFDPKYEDDGIRLDDVGIFDKIVISDEDGSDVKVKGNIMDKDTFTYSFYMLSRGGDDEKAVAVSEKFHKKYPYFLDLFIHYSPLGANPIEFIEEKSSWEKKEAYFEVDSTLECIKRHYLVKFTLDDKGYLDDAEVKCVGEYPYERERLKSSYTAVLYKHSNWNNLKLTEKFRKKYNPENGTFPEIDEVYLGETGHGTIIDLDTIIEQYIYKDGSKKWYCSKYFNDENGYLDDVKYELIDYTGEDPEEAKEFYLKEHPQE